MELVKPDVNIDFVGMRFRAFLLSISIILIGIASLVYHGGLNLGVDFAGGTLIQVKFAQQTTPEQIRSALKKLGLKNAAVQQVGLQDDHEYIVRTELTHTELKNFGDEVERELTKVYGKGQAQVRRVEMVGPKVGKDLRQKALFAIYYAILFIAIYISGRFEMKWGVSAVMAGALLACVYVLDLMGMDVAILILGALAVTLAFCWFLKLPYALAAVLALIHDVLITVGAFSLLNKEFTLEIVAALLTIVGYSLNDTIIVFDRIRENLRKNRREELGVTINQSINQTLSRTLLTSGTTLIVVACLFFLGGAVIHDFAFALLIGIVVGTYSSIFVASPIIILYEDWTQPKSKRVVKASRAAS